MLKSAVGFQEKLFLQEGEWASNFQLRQTMSLRRKERLSALAQAGVFKAENTHRTAQPLVWWVLVPLMKCSVMLFGPEAFIRTWVPSLAACFSSVFCLNLSHKLLKLAGNRESGWQFPLPQAEGVSWLTPQQPFPSQTSNRTNGC